MAAAPAFQPFRPEEFRLYESRNRSDDTLNGKRLVVRQKLQAIGEATKNALAKHGVGCERRESLHHPFSVNHMRVVAQWTSIFRDAKARKEFTKYVGPDLAKDVDPGNANFAFFVSIDESGLQFGLRLGAEAWFDAQNFVNKYSRNDLLRRELAEILKKTPGFHLRMHDWEKLYPTEKASREDLEEIFKYYRVGEHRWTCARSIPKDDPRAGAPDLCETTAASLASLSDIYKSIAWNPGNNYLTNAAGGFK